MVLGLLRVVILNTMNIFDIVSRARDKRIPWGSIFRETARWLLPNRDVRTQLFFSAISFLFHFAVIVTPIFLGAHIMLWERGVGISWISLSQEAADYLTLLAILAALLLFAKRAGARVTREMSRLQDYLLPLLISVPFISGYLAMHPPINPFDYHSVMFVHVMSGNLVLVLMPFSKLSHMALFPTTQLVSEMAWHLDPDSGHNVAVALGKEREAI
jgi:nitrate reductase gamma subunit